MYCNHSWRNPKQRTIAKLCFSLNHYIKCIHTEDIVFHLHRDLHVILSDVDIDLKDTTWIFLGFVNVEVHLSKKYAAIVFGLETLMFKMPILSLC